MLDEEVLKLIDREIRDIVRDLNKLPFLETKFSCSGHPKTHEPQWVPYLDIHYTSKEEGLKFYNGIIKHVPSIFHINES